MSPRNEEDVCIITHQARYGEAEIAFIRAGNTRRETDIPASKTIIREHNVGLPNSGSGYL
jgi:hypothetical protein